MFHKIRWTVGGEGLHKYQIRYKREHGVPYHTCSVGWCRRLFVLYRRTGGGILFSFISDDPSAYVRKLLLLLSMCYERGSGFGNKSQVLIPALPLGKSEWVALLYEFLPHLSPQVITWAKGIHELSLWDVTQVIESLFFFFNKTRIFNNFPYKTRCYIWIAVLHQSCCRAPQTKTHVDWSIYSGFARQLTNLRIFFVHLFDFLVSERWRKVEYNEIDEGCGSSIL